MGTGVKVSSILGTMPPPISLEDVIFTAEWLPEIILPDKLPVDNSSQDDIVEISPELNLEKELEPEKGKLVASRPNCLRSSVPG